MAKDDKAPRRKRYKDGNTDENGDFIVGRNRTPEHTRFRKNDGRRRGRRPKGQRNFETEFQDEARRLVTIKEGGRKRRVSKMRSTIIRAFDNAASKGNDRAIATLFQIAQRLADKREVETAQLDKAEEALIDAWLEEELAKRMAGDNPGDPPSPSEPEDPEDPQEDDDNG